MDEMSKIAPKEFPVSITMPNRRNMILYMIDNLLLNKGFKDNDIRTLLLGKKSETGYNKKKKKIDEKEFEDIYYDQLLEAEEMRMIDMGYDFKFMDEFRKINGLSSEDYIISNLEMENKTNKAAFNVTNNRFNKALEKRGFDIWRQATVTEIYNSIYFSNLLKVIGDECCNLSDSTNGDAIRENIGEIAAGLVQVMGFQNFLKRFNIELKQGNDYITTFFSQIENGNYDADSEEVWEWICNSLGSYIIDFRLKEKDKKIDFEIPLYCVYESNYLLKVSPEYTSRNFVSRLFYDSEFQDVEDDIYSVQKELKYTYMDVIMLLIKRISKNIYEFWAPDYDDCDELPKREMDVQTVINSDYLKSIIYRMMYINFNDTIENIRATLQEKVSEDVGYVLGKQKGTVDFRLDTRLDLLNECTIVQLRILPAVMVMLKDSQCDILKYDSRKKQIDEVKNYWTGNDNHEIEYMDIILDYIDEVSYSYIIEKKVVPIEHGYKSATQYNKKILNTIENNKNYSKFGYLSKYSSDGKMQKYWRKVSNEVFNPYKKSMEEYDSRDEIGIIYEDYEDQCQKNVEVWGLITECKECYGKNGMEEAYAKLKEKLAEKEIICEADIAEMEYPDFISMLMSFGEQYQSKIPMIYTPIYDETPKFFEVLTEYYVFIKETIDMVLEQTYEYVNKEKNHLFK